jgi:ubiquinone/menaquinone biosynthesis C-methylase UbiE
MRTGAAAKLLDENKHSYNRMSEEFSSSRARFWEELTFLGEHATPGMKVLDIGCGNGRFFDVIKDRKTDYTGLDNSSGLLDEARKKHPDIRFIEGDATELPFADGAFDIAYSFAVIHHIPSRTLRSRFVSEAARVLHPGNTFIITSWYLWRPRYITKLLLSSLRSMLFLSPLDIGDMMHTFGNERHTRYLHAFTERGLRRLLERNGFEVIGSEIAARSSGSGEQNILVIARKK